MHTIFSFIVFGFSLFRSLRFEHRPVHSSKIYIFTVCDLMWCDRHNVRLKTVVSNSTAKAYTIFHFSFSCVVYVFFFLLVVQFSHCVLDCMFHRFKRCVCFDIASVVVAVVFLFDMILFFFLCAI